MARKKKRKKAKKTSPMRAAEAPAEERSAEDERSPEDEPALGARASEAPTARPVEAPGRRRWIAWGSVALVVAIAFGRGAGYGLLDGWDDDRFLLENELVQRVSFDHLVAIFAEPHFEAYHPVHLLSYWLDVPWLGLDGPGLHVVNLVFWALAGIAALEAAWALGLGFWGGLGATLLLLVHPAQVEAVTWVTGRKDILALGFAALSVLFHCKSAKPFDRWRLASVLAFGAAGLSKTSVVPLPLVLIAADVWLRGRDRRQSLVAQAPALIVAFGLGAITILIWQDAEMIRGRELGLGEHLGLVGATLTHSLATVIWPASLSPLYPIARSGGFDAVEVLLGPAVLVLALVLGVRRKLPTLLFAAVGFTLLWLPVSNAIPLYFQWQDRYLSLPLWPLALGAGLGVDALVRGVERSWVPKAALLAVVAALTARTVQYVGVWRDTVTLFGHAAATHPGSFYAWLNLGHARVKAGQLASAGAAYERAVEAENLVLGHTALYRSVVLRDEAERDLSPSRADELSGRFAAVVEDPEGLRALAVEIAEVGYRRAVMLALDYSFAIAPIEDERLERAALIQIQRGHEWLARYYVSRLSRAPIHPVLQERYGITPERDR